MRRIVRSDHYLAAVISARAVGRKNSDAANYLAGLPEEKLGQHHWTVAIRMLDHALTEPAYLKTATMCFQTALAMHGVLAGPLKS